ncbi:MAG: DUF167 domain-containing protein [Acidimicrobiales bacterium]|nr:DUF167 domain-containing protein [Acidimicrobiales bacterium]
MADRSVTFRVRVRPGAKRDHVGGTWGEGADGPLNVWVSKPAVDGAANKATIQVLAAALRVRKRQLSITAGHKGRTKTLRLDEPPADFDTRLDEWRARDRR